MNIVINTNKELIMGQNKRNEMKKMWCVFSALLLLTLLELGLSIYKPFNEQTMKWALIALTSAKIFYTLSYFIYLKQKRKRFISAMIFPSVLTLPLMLLVFLMEKGMINL